MHLPEQAHIVLQRKTTNSQILSYSHDNSTWVVYDCAHEDMASVMASVMVVLSTRVDFHLNYFPNLPWVHQNHNQQPAQATNRGDANTRCNRTSKVSIDRRFLRRLGATVFKYSRFAYLAFIFQWLCRVFFSSNIYRNPKKSIISIIYHFQENYRVTSRCVWIVSFIDLCHKYLNFV